MFALARRSYWRSRLNCFDGALTLLSMGAEALAMVLVSASDDAMYTTLARTVLLPRFARVLRLLVTVPRFQSISCAAPARPPS